MDGNAAVSAEIIDAVEVAHAIAISLLVMRRPRDVLTYSKSVSTTQV